MRKSDVEFKHVIGTRAVGLIQAERGNENFVRNTCHMRLFITQPMDRLKFLPLFSTEKKK